ncbi:hypothetical protein [Chroococcidiopsis sp. SAG 2025]|uniref:hypothetical protein n=1 Tax=Chroococcidiopsis sp. SAG 2025 TaxID=171389 RepID=UPI002936DDDC|nr:hypothetical protein [Chroococcidiopsis sp. SAG 2025]
MFALIKAGNILGRGILSCLWMTGQSSEQLLVLQRSIAKSFRGEFRICLKRTTLRIVEKSDSH